MPVWRTSRAPAAGPDHPRGPGPHGRARDQRFRDGRGHLHRGPGLTHGPPRRPAPAPAAAALANLRALLWRLPPACQGFIVVSSHHLRLAADVAVDLHDAEAFARRLLDRSAPWDDADLGTALLELSRDLLPDWYDDDWVLVERERYHQLRLHALEALCDRLTAAGRYGEAVDAGLTAVRAEPLRESAHRVLIKAHIAEGNQGEASRQYESYRHLARDELGIEPSSRLRDLLPQEVGTAPGRDHG